MNKRSLYPARGGLFGAMLGLVGAVLVGAAKPDLVVLSRAATGAIAATLASGRQLSSEPLAPTLVALAALRFGIFEISQLTLLGAFAVAIATTLLLAGLVRSLLSRRRFRRNASGR
jgi:hypothetical protein